MPAVRQIRRIPTVTLWCLLWPFSSLPHARGADHNRKWIQSVSSILSRPIRRNRKNDQADLDELLLLNSTLAAEDLANFSESFFDSSFGLPPSQSPTSAPNPHNKGILPIKTTRIIVRHDDDIFSENYRFEIKPGLASAMLMQTVGAGDFLMKRAGPKWFDWVASRWLSGRSRSAIFTIIDIIRRFRDHGVVDLFAKYSQPQIFWSLVAYSGLQRTIEAEGLIEQYFADNSTVGDDDALDRVDQVEDPALLDTLSYYSVYASAAYGWKLGFAMKGTTFLKKISRGKFMGERKAPHHKSREEPFWKRNGTNFNISISDMSFFLRRTGRQESDVVAAEWGTDTHSPGYVITRDEARQALVVSVRGTWSVHDVLTDLCCTSQDFSVDKSDSKEEGEKEWSLSKRLWNWFYPQTTPVNTASSSHQNSIPSAHHGMLEAAQWLMNATQDFVDAEMRKNPQYSLVLCGHSMGGGVAALLGALWRKRYPVSVFVYGPPCLAPLHANPPTGPGGGLNIISTVVEGDPFGCISLGHIAELSVALDRLCADARLRERVLQSTMFRKGGDRGKKRQDAWWLVHTLRYLHANSTGEKHYPPGRLLLLKQSRNRGSPQRQTPGESFREKDMWTIGDVKHTHFGHFQVRPSMLDLGKHMPSLYEEALSAVSEAN